MIQDKLASNVMRKSGHPQKDAATVRRRGWSCRNERWFAGYSRPYRV